MYEDKINDLVAKRTSASNKQDEAILETQSRDCLCWELPWGLCRYKEVPESRKHPKVRNFYPKFTAGLLGQKVDAVDFWGREADHIESRILEVQKSPRDFLNPKSTAFVTFASMFPCRTIINNYFHPSYMHSSKAPEPNDIAWAVSGLDNSTLHIRNTIVLGHSICYSPLLCYSFIDCNYFFDKLRHISSI